MKNSEIYHTLGKVLLTLKDSKQIQAVQETLKIVEERDLLEELKEQHGGSKLIFINQLLTVKQDEDMAILGFKCHGRLIDSEGYKTFYERLWVWENSNAGLSVITGDEGNGYCGVVAIKPLQEEWIKPCYIGCEAWCPEGDSCQIGYYYRPECPKNAILKPRKSKEENHESNLSKQFRT